MIVCFAERTAEVRSWAVAVLQAREDEAQATDDLSRSFKQGAEEIMALLKSARGDDKNGE